MSTLFLIPARGGSKGIPGKNIKPFCGKPLICHAIDNARAFSDDELICLSTDSEEIKSVAEEYGLKVPFLRPDSLATDIAGSREVMLHALDFYRDRGYDIDKLVLLQPTSPLRRVEDIQGCIDLYSNDLDMVVSVKEAATNPYYNAFEETPDGFLHISKGSGTYTRRQDAPKVWEYNGAVYVINPESLRKLPMGLFEHRRMYAMPGERSVDLDTPTDWLIAEQLARQLG
ncbi:MAG: acylneuraminate cytidylyltransferase family protein [Prevotella sp.]|nr:acylneuraminate cytidylyltransferase family protein [Prevotella sp.]MCM1075443.1 acylneuraminate cytidylyltransferase family protein [Ruminococcus sp.]